MSIQSRLDDYMKTCSREQRNDKDEGLPSTDSRKRQRVEFSEDTEELEEEEEKDAVHLLRHVERRLESQVVFSDADLAGEPTVEKFTSVSHIQSPEDDWSDTYKEERVAKTMAEARDALEPVFDALISQPKDLPPPPKHGKDYCFCCAYTLVRQARSINDKYDKIWKIIYENYSKCTSRQLTLHVRTYYVNHIRNFLHGRPWWRCETIWLHMHQHVIIHEIECQRLLRAQRRMLVTIEKNELYVRDDETGRESVVTGKMKQWRELYKEHIQLSVQVAGKQNTSLI